ncbi:hypothetical protein O9G_000681 [Rozella allomycis CSF55]|uniref:SRR1-like domain-containing protein n=1 Tax=Rozella allomycis (strain CSF55) TaxID=988480 RepID=A0A075AY84_ROZAC|nr:hypothetical protein O9G_000681 [Rozella allomycis CSF55]|eukprot:EPZ35285.1 hypothetical protein O9G_000681 [Rozella allomycis CSF55]
MDFQKVCRKAKKNKKKMQKSILERFKNAYEDLSIQMKEAVESIEGSICTSQNAMNQLALLELLIDRFSNNGSPVKLIFDPIFSEKEIHFLEQELNYNSFTFSEYNDVQNLIVYMPHCDHELYNMILEAVPKSHWEHLIIIGNSFDAIVSS